jgi:glycine hydroxymethyltransferase
LNKAGITANKNLIPYDSRPASVTSGIRLGTPAVTTRGMKEKQMEEIADIISKVIDDFENEKVIRRAKVDVKKITDKFPLYKDLVKRMQ